MANKLLIVAAAVSLISIFILFIFAATTEPRTISPGEIGTVQLGEIVKVSGVVHSVRNNSGGTVVVLKDDAKNHPPQAPIPQLKVFIPKNVMMEMDPDARSAIVPGASVVVIGVVEEYAGEPELLIRNPQSVAVEPLRSD